MSELVKTTRFNRPDRFALTVALVIFAGCGRTAPPKEYSKVMPAPAEAPSQNTPVAKPAAKTVDHTDITFYLAGMNQRLKIL